MSEPDRRRCACGHGWVHHTNDPHGCWGPECLAEARGPRCQVWNPVSVDKPPVKRAVTRTRHDAPQTSHDAADTAKLRVGTLRYDVHRSIRFAGIEGRTDDELEEILVKSHQSVSAARNTLANDGLIVDSGVRRPTRTGNDAIVWIIAP